jgi:hypothetical protein
MKGLLLWTGFIALAYLAGTAWHMGEITQGLVYAAGALLCLFLAPSGSKSSSGSKAKAGAGSR